eukprot:NODE_10667_length_1337_cov_2.380992.p1 GENE.NODE_10667_length_1337_cov_2.380992~~NODE_10667_length_1337_cov_2.380992.p1  ORF type:complete len:423 (-),score=108.32 NODE_10667_length_1337_cov_2.380992:68-1231(-)
MVASASSSSGSCCSSSASEQEGGANSADEAGDGRQNERDLAAIMEQRLATFGEAFMASIDAGPTTAARDRRRRQPVAGAAAASASAAAGADAGRPPSSGGAGGAAASPGQQVLSGRKKKRRGRGGEDGETVASAGGTPVCDSGGAIVGAAGAQTSSNAVKADTAAAAAVQKARTRVMAASRRRSFMSDKVGKIHSGGAAAAKEKHDPNERDSSPEADDINATLRQVFKLVQPRMAKSERNLYEQRRVRALGGTPDKGLKCPYSLMQQHMKIHEQKRQHRLEEDRQLGVSTSENQHRSVLLVNRAMKQKKDGVKARKQRAESAKLMSLGMGAREKRGNAVIPRNSRRAVFGSGGGGAAVPGRKRGRGGSGSGGRGAPRRKKHGSGGGG